MKASPSDQRTPPYLGREREVVRTFGWPLKRRGSQRDSKQDKLHFTHPCADLATNATGMSGFLESVGNVCKGTLVVLCTPVLIPHAVYRNKCARRVPFAAEIEDEAMDEGVRRKRQSNLTNRGD